MKIFLKLVNLMKTLRFISLAFLFSLIFSGSFAQETEPVREDDEEQKIEKIAGSTENEIDYAELFQDLEYYKKHPINLNRAHFDDLKVLFFLNEIQINNLLDHIKNNGKLLSIYELQSVAGFDDNVINMMLPFVKVDEDISVSKFNFRDIFKYGDYDLMVRYQRVLQVQKGYTTPPSGTDTGSYYLGSPDKVFTRFRFKYFNKISFGITGEKDPGEQFFKGSQKYGFDFYSAHLIVRDLGFVRTIALGDYYVQFGQGLTMWAGLGFGKSSDVVGTKKMPTTIRPYTSVDENNFLRGAATTLGIKNFELTMFYSRKKVDGNLVIIDSINNYQDYYISSLQSSGLHRSPNEIADKDAVMEQVYGGHFAYRTRKLNIGATASFIEFDKSLERRLYPYNQFEFNGKKNYNIGIDYSYTFRNFSFFGEAARSENGGMAFIDGIMVSVTSKLSFSILYRYYQKNYQAIYSSAFGEGSSCSNEQGLFSGVQFKISPKIMISAYCDNYSFPWMRYRTDAPSLGQDYLAELMYKPNKKVDMYCRYTYENKQINTDDISAPISYLVNTEKQSVRFNFSYPVTNTITFKNRAEYIIFKKEGNSTQHGYLIYQDIRFKPLKVPLAVSFRYELFDADSYDARLYAFENDVLYSYSIPMLYNKGSRFYIMLKYKIGRHVDLWLRYAQTTYSDIDVISSGMEEIQGNIKSEIKAQLRVNF